MSRAPHSEDKGWRAAIVRIDVRRADGSVDRGTGFVVTPEHVLTCLHVVADRKAEPPVIYSDIEVSFTTGDRVSHRRGESGEKPKLEVLRYDAVTDWALLRLSVPAAVKPLVLGPDAGREEDISFGTWGYPDLNSLDGKTFKGEVRNWRSTYAKRAPALELYSEEVKGIPVHGLSGAPCIVDGVVVGLMRVSLDEIARSAPS